MLEAGVERIYALGLASAPDDDVSLGPEAEEGVGSSSESALSDPELSEDEDESPAGLELPWDPF